MKKKIIIIVLVIITILSYGIYWAFFNMDRLPKDISVFSSSCSSNNQNTPMSINSNQITTIKNNTPLVVNYIGYEDHYRFISKSASILWMPDDSSPKVTELTNTLVEVMFAGYTTENNVWLFVSYRTYDSPTNNRGWIRESNTETYTKENQKLVKDIIIPKGTFGVDNNPDYVEDIDQFGFIEKREDDKVLVMFAGGKELWYYEKNIKYPPLD